MGFESKVTGIEEFHDGVRQVLFECPGAGGQEERVLITPNGQERRLLIAEILLKFRVQRHIAGIVFKEVKLDFYVTGLIEKMLIQRIGFGRNQSFSDALFGIFGIELIALEANEMAAEPLSNRTRGTGAEEWIEDHIARLCG